MFWIEYRNEDGTTHLSSATGLTYGELQAAKANPRFVREFQGDQFGREYGKGKRR